MGEALISRRGGKSGGSNELKLIGSGSIKSGTRTTITLPNPLSSYKRLVFTIATTYTTNATHSSSSALWDYIHTSAYRGNVTPADPFVTDGRMFAINTVFLFYINGGTCNGDYNARVEAQSVPYKDTVVEIYDISNGTTPDFYDVASGTFFGDENIITFKRDYGVSGTLTNYGTYSKVYTTIEVYGVEA